MVRLWFWRSISFNVRRLWLIPTDSVQCPCHRPLWVRHLKGRLNYIYHNNSLNNCHFLQLIIQEHQEKCDSKVLECVVSACDKKFLRKFEDVHYKEWCEYRMVQCLFCKNDYILAFEEIALFVIFICNADVSL